MVKQNKLNGRVAKFSLSPFFAGWQGLPLHVFIKPNRQRTARFQCGVIGVPIGGFVLVRFRFAHALILTAATLGRFVQQTHAKVR